MNELVTQNDMLPLFGPIDEEWQSTTRSIRIDGKVTSVRLENFHWRIVKEIADKENLLLSQLMTKLSWLANSSQGDHANFTSFIRVCCARYLEVHKNAVVGRNTAIGTEQDAARSRFYRAVS